MQIKQKSALLVYLERISNVNGEKKWEINMSTCFKLIYL